MDSEGTANTASTPEQVDELDRLQIENYTVRMELLKTKIDYFRLQIDACNSSLREIQDDMQGFQSHLEEKYGIDLTRMEVLSSGHIVRAART